MVEAPKVSFLIIRITVEAPLYFSDKSHGRRTSQYFLIHVIMTAMAINISLSQQWRFRNEIVLMQQYWHFSQPFLIEKKS